MPTDMPKPMHAPPAYLKDFDASQKDPSKLYAAWDQFITDAMTPPPNFPVPAWYDPLHPPVAGQLQTAAPPWQGLPRTALLLNGQDVLAAATAVDSPVEFGSGTDALNVTQPDFVDSKGIKVAGLKYRPQDEYLEWVTLRDSDNVVREIWFTCEGPEYWQTIAENDPVLLVSLYSNILGVKPSDIDQRKLFFQDDVTHVEPFARNKKLHFPKNSYNIYNPYNIAGAVHLTQGANTLGAEISLAMAGSLIYGDPGDPPKTMDPDLICCAGYGEPNRNSDPTIGNEVNTLARKGLYVTLRDPVGLYINTIDDAQFTDWNGNPIPNFGKSYFTALRGSPDGSMVVRAKLSVPAGVMRNGKQARVGDLNCNGSPITMGGQVANAITMNLYAQALPGAPAQNTQQPCVSHPCPDPAHPGYVIPTRIGVQCKTPGPNLVQHIAAMRPETAPVSGKVRRSRWHA